MLKRKDFDRLFTKMKADRKECKHHIRGFIDIGHGVSVPVFVSHSSKEVPYFVIEKLSKSLKINKKKFIDLCKCRLSREEYFALLKKSN